MSTIAKLDRRAQLQLQRRAQRRIHGADSLEQAAQRYVETIYAELSDSLVLLRLFATVPFAALPEPRRVFVEAIAEAMGTQLADETSVLTLLGTVGVEPAWCDAERSQGHLAIPLASKAFVDAVPMLSRMLQELGVGLDWFDNTERAIVGKTFGLQSSLFYVERALEAVDGRGRKIITAQTFAARYGVETVFGVGGGYVGTPVFMTIIGFCRETLAEAQVEGFRAHVDRVKAETEALVAAGRIFKPA